MGEENRMSSVYHYKKLQNDLQALMNKYDFIKMNIIGKSVLGRDIYELRVGTGEKKIHFNASFHANEWITTVVLMSWLEDRLIYISQLTNKNEYLKSIQLSIVPMVNPDGVELIYAGKEAAIGLYDVARLNENRADFYNWKANIRGVDLNKQFPAKWTEYKESIYCKEPYYRDYPGEEPLTEPEAIAMYELVKQNDFDMLIGLHTQGNEFYWGYCGLEPPNAESIAREFEKVSGMKGIQNIESHAGFRDWFISEYQKPGFTLELGKGINPIPLSQLEEIKLRTFPVLDAALYM